jgi:hypothetical protein
MTIRRTTLFPANALLLGSGASGAETPAVVDVARDFGAKADDGATDNLPAFNRALAALPPSGGVVKVPGAAKFYGVSAPINLRGTGVTLRGEGADVSRIAARNPYAGAVAALAGPESVGAEHRPADPTAAGRFGVATLGTHQLVMSGQPANLGGRGGYDGVPDGWASPRLSIDFDVARPAGADWSAGAFLFGMADLDGGADPWFVAADGDGLHLDVTTDQGQYRFLAQGVRFAPGERNRFRFDVDGRAGSASAVRNGAPCPLVILSNGARRPWGPGVVPRRCDGFAPMMVGSYGPGPRDDGKPVTDLVLYRLDVANAADKVFSLPMNDPGASPFVRVQTCWYDHCAWWVASARTWAAKNCTVEGLGLVGGLAVGEGTDLAVRDCRVGGLQAVHCVPGRVKYELLVERCDLDGKDVAFCGDNATAVLRDVKVRMGGRESLRLRGCGYILRNLKVYRIGPNAESIVRMVAGDGSALDVDGLWADNEEATGAATLGAILDVEQSPDNVNQVFVRNLNVAALPPQAGCVVLRYRGRGWGGPWRPTEIRLSRVSCQDETGRAGCAAVDIQGPLSAHGSIDVSGLALGSGLAAGPQAQAGAGPPNASRLSVVGPSGAPGP